MKTEQDWLYCISGALLFSFSMNVFLVPLHIYSAGFLGIAQLLRDLLLHILPYRLSLKNSRVPYAHRKEPSRTEIKTSSTRDALGTGIKDKNKDSNSMTIAVYSIVHSCILSFVLDRIHEDNAESDDCLQIIKGLDMCVSAVISQS